jgi:hypothetical protein
MATPYKPTDLTTPPFHMAENPDPYQSFNNPNNLAQGADGVFITPGNGSGGGVPQWNETGPSPQQQQASNQTRASLNGMLTSMTNGVASTPSAGAPPVAMGDTSAGTAAAFARAKDQTGLNTRASLRAFQDQMAGNQMMGSGLEMTGTRDIIEHGAGQLNEVTREQAVKDAQMNNQRVMADYQGRVTQRGQDLGVAQSNANRQQQTLETLLSMIGGGVLY